MLRNVPGASSSLGLPATVTLPGLLQEQHRTAARGLRENTAFVRDFVHAGAARKGEYEASAARTIAAAPTHHTWCLQPLNSEHLSQRTRGDDPALGYSPTR
jgi:hypothetical protein